MNWSRSVTPIRDFWKNFNWYKVGTYVLLSIPAVPLVYSNKVVFGSVVPSTSVFVVATCIALCALLFLFLQRLHVYSYTIFDFLIACLAVLGLLATYFSQDPFTSFWGTLGRMEGLVFYLVLFIYVYTTSIFFKKKNWLVWLWVWFVSALCMSMIGFSQYAGLRHINDGELRIEGLLGNPVFFGSYMMYSVGIGVILSVYARSTVARYSVLGLTLFILFALIISGTRSAFLGLCIGVVVSLVAWSSQVRHIKYNFKKYATIIGTLLFACVSLYVLHTHDFISLKIINRFETLNLETLTDQTRYHLYTSALNAITDRFYIGYGFESFDSLFEQYVTPMYYGANSILVPELWFDRVHNAFLEWCMSVGVLGGLIYVLLIAYTCTTLWKLFPEKQREGSVLIGLMSAYVVHTSLNPHALPDHIIFGTMLAYARSLRLGYANQNYSLKYSPKILLPVAIIFIVAILGITTTISRLHFSADARSVLDANSEGTLEKMYSLASLGRMPAIDRSYVFGELFYEASVFQQKKKDREKVGNLLMDAEELYLAQRPLAPKDRYYLAQAYSMSGLYGRGESLLTDAIERAPNRIQYGNLLGEQYLMRGAYTEARKYLEPSYSKEPTYYDSVIRYAALLLYEGDITSSDAVLRKYGQTVLYGDRILIEAQIAARLYDRAENSLRALIVRYPDSKMYYDLLLRTYSLQEKNDEFQKLKQEMRSLF